MIFGILALLGLPLVLTVCNILSFRMKRKVFPKLFLVLTLVIGFAEYCFYLELMDVTWADWNEAVYAFQNHAPISPDFLPSFILVCAIGVVGLFTLAFVPVRLLPPLLASFSIAAVILGNACNLAFAVQLLPLFFPEGFSLSEMLLPFPLLYHLNILILSVYFVREELSSQLELLESRKATARYGWQKRLYSFLQKACRWHILAFASLFPLLAFLLAVLILFGQGADGFQKAFEMTADWTFSQQVPPPPLEYEGHYLCTVAALGHKKLVRPLGFGRRKGAVIIVNRQLRLANAFEELLQESLPRLHRMLRSFYDAHGYPISKLIDTKLKADLIYIAMKPLEYCFTIVLYACCADPEERIRRQYAG